MFRASESCLFNVALESAATAFGRVEEIRRTSFQPGDLGMRLFLEHDLSQFACSCKILSVVSGCFGKSIPEPLPEP